MRKSIILMLTYINLTLLLSFPATSVIAQTDFWEPINTGLTTTAVFALAINSSGDIFAGTNGGGVFRFTDNGDTWTATNTGLTTIRVEALAINSNGDIFAGTPGGVFRSSNNGDTWTDTSTGLTTIFVEALAINSNDDIFAGTFGGGVFRSVGSTTAVEEISSSIPSSFALEQNYPNPFNPTTTIQFTLAKGANVKLKVFSIEGKEVATLVDEALTPGVHTFRFEANGLPSGVYFYRVEAGELFQTRRLMLLK